MGCERNEEIRGAPKAFFGIVSEKMELPSFELVGLGFSKDIRNYFFLRSMSHLDL